MLASGGWQGPDSTPRLYQHQQRPSTEELLLRGSCTYILHEFLTDRTDVLAEGGGEHAHLLLVRGRSEDLLHIAPHI